MSKSDNIRKGRARGKYKIHKINPTSFKKGLVPWNKGKGQPLEKDIECKVCHTVFHYIRKRHIRSNGYYCYNPFPDVCSKECRYIASGNAQRGKEKLCLQGKNNYQWKGGFNKLSIRIRKSLRYKKMIERCFERDNYTCQLCGKRGNGELNMDHINSLSRILEFYNLDTFEEAMDCKLLWDLNNVRTLCIDCHKKTPSYMRPTKEHPQIK